MKTSEIRKRDDSALTEELQNLESMRLDISMRVATEEGEGQKLRALRRDIARIKTVLRERRQG